MFEKLVESIIKEAMERGEFDTFLECCRAALDEAAFNAAVEKGRAMTMEHAIAYALEN